MVNKFYILCLALILGLVISHDRVMAQSTIGLESRLSRLEAENLQLRSQLSTIQSQLYQLNGRSPSPGTTPIRPAPPTVGTPAPRRPGNQPLSSDPMFQRLANLAIELKERVQALEAQVAQLRGQRK